jgi:MFS family permease
VSFLNIWLQKWFQEVRHANQLASIISFIFFSSAEFLGYLTGGRFFDIKKSKIEVFFIISIFFSGLFYLIGLLLPFEIPVVETNNLIQYSWNLLIAICSSQILFLFYIIFFFAFFLYSFALPLLAGVLSENNKSEDRKIVLYIWSTLNTILQFLFPPIGGIIADFYGLSLMFFILPITLFLSLIPFLFFSIYRHKYQIPPMSP